jgi:hypothetical protein
MVAEAPSGAETDKLLFCVSGRCAFALAVHGSTYVVPCARSLPHACAFNTALHSAGEIMP